MTQTRTELFSMELFNPWFVCKHHVLSLSCCHFQQNLFFFPPAPLLEVTSLERSLVYAETVKVGAVSLYSLPSHCSGLLRLDILSSMEMFRLGFRV